MIIEATSFSARVVEIRLKELDGFTSTSKVIDLGNSLSQAARALCDGESYEDQHLKLLNDESMAYTSGTFILSGSFQINGTVGFSLDSNGGNVAKGDSLRLVGLTGYQSVACSIIKSYCDLITLDNHVSSNGLGLDAKMRVQRQGIISRLTSMEDIPLMLIDSAEQLVTLNNDYLHLSQTVRDIPSLSGFNTDQSRSTALGTALAASRSKVDERFENVTGVSSADVATKLNEFGMFGWYNTTGNAISLSVTNPMAWTPDAFTMRMLNTPNLVHYHFSRFLKNYFKGDVDNARSVAAASFGDVMASFQTTSSVKDAPASLTDYLARLDIDEPITMAGYINAQSMITSGMVEVSTESENDIGHGMAHNADLITAFWRELPSFSKSGNTLFNSNIKLTFTSEHDGWAEEVIGRYRQTAEESALLKELMQHLDTVVALIQHATHSPDVRKRLAHLYY
jgi:hypothetical protein